MIFTSLLEVRLSSIGRDEDFETEVLFVSVPDINRRIRMNEIPA